MLHFNPLFLYDAIWPLLILTFPPEQEMLAIPLVLVVLVTVWMQLVSVLHQSLTLVLPLNGEHFYVTFSPGPWTGKDWAELRGGLQCG